MDDLTRRMPWAWAGPMTGPSTSDRSAGSGTVEPLVEREWLVTNGLGGYASSTVGGVCTRRYHGYLIAALGTPHGRTMMLNHLAEQVRLPGGRTVHFGGEHVAGGALDLRGVEHLREFRLEAGLPVWLY
jgi:predicted glycogen debranching enzyme